MMNRRKNIFPQPSLQLQIIVLCVVFAACTGMMQGLLLQRFVTDLLLELPASSSIAQSEASIWVLRHFFISLAILVPFVLGLGLLISFRFAGPLVNIEKHLNRLAAGEDPGPCRLRKGDQLHHLADAVNRAVATVRGGSAQGTPAGTPVETAPQTVEQTTP